jgi:hypothetical protein
MRAMLLVVVGGVAAIITGVLAYHHYRFRLLGDVKDADGRPIQGCTVELARRWFPQANWIFYIARESTTNSDGAFAFDILSPPGGTFRLRVVCSGHEKWLIEAPASSVPKYVHVTPFRDTERPPGGRISDG